MRKISSNEQALGGIAAIILLIIVGVAAMSIIAIMWTVVAFVGAIMVLAGIYFVLEPGVPSKLSYVLIIGGALMVCVGFLVPGQMTFALPGADFVRGIAGI